MKLSAIQYKPPKAQTQVARGELLQLVEQSAKQGADIIVCPEMAVSGYVFESKEHIRPHCERADGPTARELAKIAKAYRSWIVCGIAEEAPDGTLYNSAVVLSSTGNLVACYRKILLYELDETWCTPGTERMLIQTEFGSLAPAICMDLNDNELIYWMWRARPDILAFCTNWLNQDSPIDSYWKWRTPHWNGWFVGANRWGVDVSTPFRGESAIIAPNKETVAQAQIEGDAILMWDTENTSEST